MTEIGHNNPPPYDQEEFEKMKLMVDAQIEAGNQWLAIKEIDSEERAEKASDFRTGLIKAHGIVEAERKKQKKPHDDAGREVQKAFTPLLDRLDKAKDVVAPKITAYLAKKEEEAIKIAEEERLKREAEADEARRKLAEANDIDTQIEAEKEIKEIEKSATKAPPKVSVGSATGAGRATSVKTFRYAEIKDINQLFIHYRDRKEVADLLTSLANADIRASKGAEISIPGVNIATKKGL